MIGSHLAKPRSRTGSDASVGIDGSRSPDVLEQGATKQGLTSTLAALALAAEIGRHAVAGTAIWSTVSS